MTNPIYRFMVIIVIIACAACAAVSKDAKSVGAGVENEMGNLKESLPNSYYSVKGGIGLKANLPGGYFSVMDYGAKADSRTDDTRAIQRTINKAAKAGGMVYVPPGRYVVKGSLDILPGVTMEGVRPSVQGIDSMNGTVFFVTGNPGNENGPAAFRLGHSSSVRNVSIFYPQQSTAKIIPFPWTFQMTGYDNLLEGITFFNAYNGIQVGPGNNVRHRIRDIYGCVLRRGIYVDECTDVGRIENVHFIFHHWSYPGIAEDRTAALKFMDDNLEAFIFGRTDWEYVTNTFVYPCKIGYKFIQTKEGAANGHFTGIGADSCDYSFWIEDIQHMGILITGGEFAAWGGDEPTQVMIRPSCKGNVRFVNCSFWGGTAQNAKLEGSGFTSFSDCYFHINEARTDINPKANKEWAKNAHIYSKNGNLQINNSTFVSEEKRPTVKLEPGTTSAIIRGNNGNEPIRIVGEAQQTIVSDNLK